MRGATIILGVTLVGAVLACKRAPDELPPSDAGGPRPASDGATLQGAVTANGPVNSQRAQDIGMQYAALHWPQYHPRMSTAHHTGTFYSVVIEFQEPVGAHVIVDSATGNVMDAGTSNGEH
jgi:hypothetical protein